MTETIRRHGQHIRLGGGVTATEGQEDNLPTLTIRKGGKTLHFYRGSSLVFGKELTTEDKEYLADLASSPIVGWVLGR